LRTDRHGSSVQGYGILKRDPAALRKGTPDRSVGKHPGARRLECARRRCDATASARERRSQEVWRILARYTARPSSPDAVGLTQEQVAEAVGLPRTAVSLLESGQRDVTSTELHALARLYGRRLHDFFTEDFDPAQTLLLALRSVGATELPAETQREVLHLCQEVGHALRSLERLLGIPVLHREAGSGESAHPKSAWDALERGEQLAHEERGRLGLGTDPAPDLVDLFERQGVLTATLELPADVEGLTLNLPELGPFIVINRCGRNLARRRFALAHEYAHVLLDSAQRARVTHRSHQDDLREKRANRFAAAFLMPAQGVLDFLAALGKRPRENSSVVMDGTNVYAVRNPAPASDSALPAHDVVQLSHYFGVGHETAIYRLDSLKFLSASNRDALWQAHEHGRLQDLAGVFFGPTAGEPAQEEPDRLQRRFLSLTLDALRREEITKSRAKELFRLVGLDEDAFAASVKAEGIVSSAKLDVPRG
jgi:Zn-dependent peptidase ImmA (M78 family)/transcriptional regulator with XRE-family HTH domain